MHRELEKWTTASLLLWEVLDTLFRERLSLVTLEQTLLAAADEIVEYGGKAHYVSEAKRVVYLAENCGMSAVKEQFEQVQPVLEKSSPEQSCWRRFLTVRKPYWIEPKGYVPGGAGLPHVVREKRLRAPDGRESILARFVRYACVGRLDRPEEVAFKDHAKQLLDDGVTFEGLPPEIVEKLPPFLYQFDEYGLIEVWRSIRVYEQSLEPAIQQTREHELKKLLGRHQVMLSFVDC